MAFSKANGAPSSIWSSGLHMQPSVYGRIIICIILCNIPTDMTASSKTTRCCCEGIGIRRITGQPLQLPWTVWAKGLCMDLVLQTV
jgi:hypothetical protein